ncbi:AsmA2 domain-containing protein YhdP [Xenorhabdus littoralis]|uniref:AsmA2 domain-containing protein YhdP n=1 Tax=Xenorhabdus littoralis TaxID=2582835 RepID=UPI0029E7FFD1|nr:AsmA2 domain-containing protein YhdP [Xenorhabdus sp. psl]MDX7990325.1 AsmA2 domain-containing protein [Xenorhabdus sp. psl]
MRRLPGILLATAAIAIIIVALLVSGLRFFLPHINDYRQQLAEKIAAVTDIPVNIGYINGHWEPFGPSLEIRDISAKSKNVDISAKKITLSLDVWRSLLQWRWHFRDLSFYQLQVNYDKALFGPDGENMLSEPDSLSALFLEQFNHFDLHDSRLTFLTPSGEKADLLLPQLTWLNQNNRHRAQGSVNLSSINGQEGIVQVKFDLKDINGILDNGVIYLQADDIDMRLWLSHWLRNNTGLENAHFSLASWITLKDGRVDSGRLQLKQGEANWHVSSEKHQLAVNDLFLQMRRQGDGWLFDVPNLESLKTRDQQWPVGHIAALYVNQSHEYQGKDHWRIRAENIQLERLNGILPILSFVTPDIVKNWQQLQPKGRLSSFALDITPELPDELGIRMKWQDVSWLLWKDLPSVSHFSGVLEGNKQWGNLRFELKDSTIDYGNMFQAPLEIASSEGDVSWKNNSHGMEVWSQGLDLQAKSLWLNGHFRYLKPSTGQPILEILAGIRADDVGEAWRYFPKPLMGESLTDYLTTSLIKGQVDNATVIFRGDPHDFPFTQNNGQFQIAVPLRNATFQYQPDWPALFDLDIDLNFQNNGLRMQAAKAQLGEVNATQVSAVIPDYDKYKLFIDAELSGDGKGIHDYFNHSPMADSIGSALDSLQLDGRVDGKLHLDIPLEHGEVKASGEIALKDTDLFIKPLNSQMKHLSGKFRFDNGNLKSDVLSANWFGHPLSLRFSTQDLPKHYLVGVNLDARWAAQTLPALPAEIRRKLSGTLNWQGKVNITIPSGKSSANNRPSTDNVKYRVAVDADLSHLSSKLPALDTESLREWNKANILAEGDMNQLQLKGSMGKRYTFNTQWMLEKEHVRLRRGIFYTDGEGIPALPEKSLFALKLPAIDGEKLLALAESVKRNSSTENGLLWPSVFEISLPSLDFGGQRWSQLEFGIVQQADGMKVSAAGEEINGSVLIHNSKSMQASINYLYYDPNFTTSSSEDDNKLMPNEASSPHYSLNRWPELNIECTECWIAGLKLGKVSASIMPEGDSLILTKGQVENSAGKLSLSGRWYENSTGNYTQNYTQNHTRNYTRNYTQLKGQLSGKKFDDMAAYLGFVVPIVDAPFKFDFNVNWRDVPWQPDLKTLNGTLAANMKKGAIAKLGGGRAGQLLRLISFDALLRKLQLDFSDTFNNDFNFDSISGDATIKNGVMYTDNFLIDGLAADINATGKTDLVNRQINMELVITPEISTTVGVATAFAINPVVGAAVFAATKVLGPLWNKISVIRYRLTGSLEQPKIDEVLRQLKEKKGP